VYPKITSCWTGEDINPPKARACPKCSRFLLLSREEQLNEQGGSYRHSGTAETIQEAPFSPFQAEGSADRTFIDDDGQVSPVSFIPPASCFTSMRNYEVASCMPDVCLAWLAAGDSREPTSFGMKTAVRSASNRERLRSVNDCVERCACQSVQTLLTYACHRFDTWTRACGRTHVYIDAGDCARDTYLVRASVRPAIGYSRDVTDFTGRRANEKLVGCELARGQRLHPPSPRCLLPSPPSSGHPRLTAMASARFYPTFPLTTSCHETLGLSSPRNITWMTPSSDPVGDRCLGQDP